MGDTDATRDELLREVLRRVATRLVTFVALALLAVAVLAPIVDQEKDDADHVDRHLSLLQLIGQLEQLHDSFGGEYADIHPYAVGVGLPLVTWGAVILLLTLLGAAAAAVTMWAVDERWPRIALRVAAVFLVLAPMLVWLGAVLLPETQSSVQTGPAWGLWAPIVAGAWLLANHRDVMTLMTDPPTRHRPR